MVANNFIFSIWFGVQSNIAHSRYASAKYAHKTDQEFWRCVILKTHQPNTFLAPLSLLKYCMYVAVIEICCVLGFTDWVMVLIYA